MAGTLRRAVRFIGQNSFIRPTDLHLEAEEPHFMGLKRNGRPVFAGATKFFREMAAGAVVAEKGDCYTGGFGR